MSKGLMLDTEMRSPRMELLTLVSKIRSKPLNGSSRISGLGEVIPIEYVHSFSLLVTLTSR